MATHVLARPITVLSEGAKEAPTELTLFGMGDTSTTKGIFRLDADGVESARACYARLGRLLPIDYEHASLGAAYAPNPAEAGTAAGHFELGCGPDGLRAVNIKWTPKATQKILDKEYLYVSPVFTAGEDGRIAEIWGLALTNDPATLGAPPLVASRGSQETETMKLVLSQLGLKDTASEAEAVIALNAIKTEVNQFVALSGKTTVAEALGVLSAWSQLPAQIEALKAEAANARIQGDREVVLSKAKAAGKLTPAAEKFAREAGKTWPVETLSAYVDTLPIVSGAGPEPKPVEGGEVTLSAEELEIARLTNVDPAKVLANKKATLARNAK